MLLVYTNHVLFCWLPRLELGCIIYQEFSGFVICWKFGKGVGVWKGCKGWFWAYSVKDMICLPNVLYLYQRLWMGGSGGGGGGG
jgi:hypothetical protein